MIGPEKVWTKSSASASQNQCVEVALPHDTDEVLVRNSRDPHGAVLSFTRAEWRAFIAGAAAGEFPA